MSRRSILISAPFIGAPSAPLTSPSNDETCAKPIAQNRIPRAGMAKLRNFMEPPKLLKLLVLNSQSTTRRGAPMAGGSVNLAETGSAGETASSTNERDLLLVEPPL